MHGYSQPTDYRFSHDSIELAARAAARLNRSSGLDGSRKLRILDLCAGCGVVGFEFARQVRIPVSIDFNEVQDIYRPHFLRNLEWMNCLRNSDLEATWLGFNYDELLKLEFEGQYDLVLSNPPYFDREQGKLPPSDFKARCRFFIDSDFATLWRVIRHVLRPAGQALVLVRDLGDHGVDRGQVLDEILNARGSWSELEPVRGTGLVLFTSGS